MKILKNVIMAFGVILIIASIGIYFLPSHYQISNSIEISQPLDVVYSQIADYNKWKAWSPWAEMEPDAKSTIEGTPGTIGHKMIWEGVKTGVGSMTIADVNPNVAIAADLAFLKPMKATSRDYWKFETIGDKTKVTWLSSGDLAYPLGRLFGLSVDENIGVPERHGLDNLKKVCEAIESVTATAIVSDTATVVAAK